MKLDDIVIGNEYVWRRYGSKVKVTALEIGPHETKAPRYPYALVTKTKVHVLLDGGRKEWVESRMITGPWAYEQAVLDAAKERAEDLTQAINEANETLAALGLKEWQFLERKDRAFMQMSPSKLRRLLEELRELAGVAQHTPSPDGAL